MKVSGTDYFLEDLWCQKTSFPFLKCSTEKEENWQSYLHADLHDSEVSGRKTRGIVEGKEGGMLKESAVTETEQTEVTLVKLKVWRCLDQVWGQL